MLSTTVAWRIPLVFHEFIHDQGLYEKNLSLFRRRTHDKRTRVFRYQSLMFIQISADT